MASNKIIIAVTGKQGSGKSTLCNHLAREFGGDLFNLDIYSHKALQNEKVIEVLTAKFGSEILEGGQINRKALGKIVFADEGKLKFLNALVYSYMEKALKQDISQAKSVVILDYALLPLTSFWASADYKILMDADISVRMERLVKRDKVDMKYLQSREKAGLDYSSVQVDSLIRSDSNLDFAHLAKNLKAEIITSIKQGKQIIK